MNFRRLVPIALATALGFACDTARTVQQHSVADFYENDQFFGASFSPDNSKILVTSNLTGVYNAYVIPVGGGEPQALTESTDDAVFASSYFPDDERFLYSQDRGIDGYFHRQDIGVRCDPLSVASIARGLEELRSGAPRMKESIRKVQEGGGFDRFRKSNVCHMYEEILAEVCDETRFGSL